MTRSAPPARLLRLLALLLLPLSLTACDGIFPGAPADEDILDGPLDDLTGAQAMIHAAGDTEFSRQFTAAEGVGPIFVAASCNTCHANEGPGHPAFAETRFGRMTPTGFDFMESVGGPQLQNRAIPGYPAEVLPTGTTGVTRINAPLVTGLGLLETVDDETLLALQDEFDADGDGISGRVQLIDADDLIADITSLDDIASNGTRNVRVDGQYIGRFGKKARTINLLHQTVFAYSEDMGLTTDFITRDLVNVQAVGSSGEDSVPDPEIASSIVSNVLFYLRTLRPPLRRNADAPAVVAGETLFASLGCASCHRPTLTTGVSNIPQLSQKTFHPYTDLLLHDMGPELDDGYTEGRATTSEWRTAPLWGAGIAANFQGGRAYYLHDGRANTFDAAIQYHGGEAAASRAGYNRLSADDKAKLVAFLASL